MMYEIRGSRLEDTGAIRAAGDRVKKVLQKVISLIQEDLKEKTYLDYFYVAREDVGYPVTMGGITTTEYILWISFFPTPSSLKAELNVGDEVKFIFAGKDGLLLKLEESEDVIMELLGRVKEVTSMGKTGHCILNRWKKDNKLAGIIVGKYVSIDKLIDREVVEKYERLPGMRGVEIVEANDGIWVRIRGVERT